jgi:ABC-type nickel/cobalt efflux system permease component RcnA
MMSLLTVVALMAALQLVMNPVANAKDIHVHDHDHDHDHDHHDHAHHDHSHHGGEDKSGVKTLSADEEAKVKTGGEKHT